MGVFNRRNAILGWTVWQATKQLAKRKAKQGAPKADKNKKADKSKNDETESRRPGKPAIAAAVLGVAAAVAFWRKKSSGDDAPD